MKFAMTGQEKCDLILVTACATVVVFLVPILRMIVNILNFNKVTNSWLNFSPKYHHVLNRCNTLRWLGNITKIPDLF